MSAIDPTSFDRARDRLREVDGAYADGDPEPGDSLLDAEAAGQLLNVPKSWVLAEARAERIPHVRLGRYVRFEAEELRRWWRERACAPRVRT